MAGLPKYDLLDLRVEQATMLKTRAIASGLFVSFIIFNYTIILMVTSPSVDVMLWFAAAMAMVGATYLYAKKKAPEGITRDNVLSYLRGHVFISSLTGIVWGGFAVIHVDLASLASVFIVTLIVSGISLGGMLPGSAYRPGYIAISTFTLLPFAAQILTMARWPDSLMGFALLTYYAFGWITSRRGELDLRESILARHERERTAKIEAENQIIRRVNEEKSRFLAATSHDLSQPLHAQGYFIQSLREKLDDADQLNLLRKIEQTWRRQGDFLRGLIDMNRLDSGAVTPKPERIELKTEMEALAEEFMASAAEKKLTLTTNFSSIVCHADPVLLKRIIRNLVSNAVKYTPVGGSIFFGLEEKEDHATIIVRDNGPGIPRAEHERIFDEYTQLGETSDGVGLGLSIVARLVALLGLDLQLVSDPGEGTEFTLKIMLGNDIPSIAAKPSTAVAKPNAPFDIAPLIVLVDDETPIRESMSSLLTDWGCQLITSGNGAEALALLGETPEIPTLLIIDKCLEDTLDGLQLINLLREEVNEETPAILMSGNPVELQQHGFDDDIQYLRKPVDPEIIHQKISTLING